MADESLEIAQLRERNRQVEKLLHEVVCESIPALASKGGYVIQPDTFGRLASLYSPAIAQLRELHVRAQNGIINDEDITAALEAMNALKEKEPDAPPG